MVCSKTLEGVVRRITRTERRITDYHVGVTKFSTPRTFYDVECRIDGHTAYLRLQAGTAFYLRSGDHVQAAGCLADEVLVIFALRNLTDGSLYCFGTKGGRYRRLVRRIERITGWITACLATPLILLGALETCPASPMKAAAIVVGGAAGAWLTHRLGMQFAIFRESGYLPGNAETESSAQALINVDAEEADRIIWV